MIVPKNWRMSLTIQLDLPETVIEQATKLGLLDSNKIADWLAGEVRRRVASQELKQKLVALRSSDKPIPSLDEINAEIKAVRSERRARETRR